MTNRVDPNETARYEPSHQDLHCLQRYVFWSARSLKNIKITPDIDLGFMFFFFFFFFRIFFSFSGIIDFESKK